MMCNFLVDGVLYAYSVMKLPLKDYFNVGEGLILLPGSVAVGVYMLCGPVYTKLCDRYGCRASIMVGSLISCLAMALSISSSSVYVLLVIYGIVGGFGFGLIYLPSIVVLSTYFDRRLTLVTGIVVSGSGIGVLAFGQIAGLLFDVYGWKGGMLILSGMIFNCAVCGALMKPPPQAVELQPISVSNAVSSGQKGLKCPASERGCPDSGRWSPAIEKSANSKPVKGINAFIRFDLICDSTILSICVANLFGFLAFLLVMMLLVTVTEKQVGASPVQARFSMTVLGIANTIGRFLFGWLPGPKTCSISLINYVTLALCAVTCFTMPWLRTYLHVMVFAVAFGIFTAPYVGLTPAVVKEAVGPAIYTDALGLAFFFRGFSSMIGPTLGGAVYDATGSFHAAFMMSGAAFLVCSALHAVAPWTKRIKCGPMYTRIPSDTK